ncbi:MAG TPA: S9 family peptidase [Acidobacteriaceae bacterium]
MRLHLCAALLLPFLTPAAVYPQTPPPRRPMTFEDMQRMRRLDDLSLSPDGHWVLFAVTDVDLEQNRKTSHLWVVPTGVGSKPMEEKPVTAALAGEGHGRFSPDGTQILFQSTRDGAQQVYVANFDAHSGTLGEARQVTHAAMGADGAMWSPDGKNILYTSSVYPECGAGADEESCNAERAKAKAESKVKAQIFTHLLYRHWNAFTGERRSHLFLQPVSGSPARDLNPGDEHEVPPFSLGGPDAYAFSADSKELTFEENTDPMPAISTHVDLWTLDLTNPAAKPVKISTSAGGNFSPVYSPDGKYIAWRSQARAGYESDRFRLALYNRVTKKITWPMEDFDRWVDELAWAPDSQSIYFTSGDEGEEPIFQLDLGSGQRSYIARRGEYADLHVTPDNTHMVASRTTVRRPPEITLLNLTEESVARNQHAAKEPALMLRRTRGRRVATLAEPSEVTEQPLTRLNRTLLAQLDIPDMEHYWFHGSGGVRVEGFLIRPPGFDPEKKYPVKFLIHGGPQGAWGDSWSYRWNAELFAADGYAVVMVNPRGSTGYGQAFVDGVNGDWGGRPYIDLMRGLDAAEIQFPFLDRKRECALGASYGGFMADWILGHTDRFRCIVSHDGMFNPESAYGTTDELWFNEWEFRGMPWTNRLMYRRWSPMLFANRFKTPTLVVHSQLDYRLDVSEGYQLFTTLQRLGVPSEMLYFPDEGHWVLKPQNSQLWYKTVNAWCDRWTQPAAPGAK